MGAIHCSEFTRNLHRAHREFHNGYVEDSTFTGVFMREIVSRIIMIGVTLLLHAEAVYRAIHACYLEISRVCQMSNQELLDSDVELLKSTCQHTWTSFKAIFDLSTLQTEDPLAISEESLNTGASQPTVIYHEVPLDPGEGRSSEDSILLSPDSSFAIDLSEGDTTMTPSQREGGQELGDVDGDEEFGRLPQFFANSFRARSPIPEEASPGGVPPLEPEMATMPELPDMQAFGQLPPFAFDVGPILVEPAESLNMPVIPEPRAVHVTPYVQRANQLSRLELRDVERILVEPAESLNMPKIPEPRAVHVTPYVQRANQLSPLELRDVGPILVEPAESLNMPKIPEPRAVHVTPYVQRANQLSPLELRDVGPILVEPAESLNMPKIPEPRAVQVPRSAPLVPPGIILPASGDVRILAVDGIPVGEPSPPLSPVSLPDDYVYIPEAEDEEDMAIRDFLPIFGTGDPGVVHENHFSDPNIDPSLLKTIEERCNQLIEEGLKFLQSDASFNVVKVLGENRSTAINQSSAGKGISEFSSKSLQGDPGCHIKVAQAGQYSVGLCCYKGEKLGAEQLAQSVSLSVGKEKRASLIGIFDPIGGQKAARFLRVNFPKILAHYLDSLPSNQEELSQEDIYVGTSLAFLHLNILFFQKFPQYAAQGSSATVVFIVGKQLWIANVGTSRAILRDQRRAFPHTPLCDDSAFGLACEQRSAFPTITVRDLSEIHLGSHLIIGNQALFEQAGTVRVVDWINAYDQEDLGNLAYLLVHSVYRSYKRGNPIPPISCGVISLDSNCNLWEPID